MTQFKGVLFDKDGTLLDVMQTWFPVYQEILSEFHPGDDARVMNALVAGGYDPETHNFKEGSMLAAGTPDEMVDIWWPELEGAERAERIVEADRLCTEKGLRNVREILPLGPYFETLKARGFHIGIATNDNTQSATQQMEKLSVLELIDFTIGFDAVENPKPAGDMVHAFCGHMGLSPKEVVVVGDNSHDMHMARAAGAGMSVAVLSGNCSHDDICHLADLVLDDIGALGDHL